MELIFFIKEKNDIMVNIIKEDLDIEEAFKKKIEFICSFCNTSCEIKKVSIRTIEKTNLSYVKPHKIIVKGITFLAFNYETNIYVENLSNKILIKDNGKFILEIIRFNSFYYSFKCFCFTILFLLLSKYFFIFNKLRV